MEITSAVRKPSAEMQGQENRILNRVSVVAGTAAGFDKTEGQVEPESG